MNDTLRSEERDSARSLNRRMFLARSGAAGLGAAALAATLAGCGGGGDDNETVPVPFPPGTNPQDIIAPPQQQQQPGAQNPAQVTDADILNFALNLEYIEAELYARALTGQGLSAADVGPSPGQVNGGRQVNFTNPVIRDIVAELGSDEIAHVRFLRRNLGGAAISRPPIDFQAGFTAAAQAAGVGPFDPFANEINLALAAVLFEDVGVTAYKGAAPLIQSKAFLEAAAGILAVEGYHASILRTLIIDAGPQVQNLYNRISDARDSLDGPADKDQGVLMNGQLTVVPADNNAIAFSRTPVEVLRIAYLGGVQGGGFFPSGVYGPIRVAA